MKVHLGCGTRCLPGFVHVDARPLEGIDHVATADNLPFADESVELLYWCHGLEHIQRPKVKETLFELRRVLMMDGVLRLSLPDLSVLAWLYAHNQVGIEKVVGPIHGRQDYPDNIHYCSYDLISLTQVLNECGFHHVTLYNPYQVNPDGYDDYSYARINDRLISLNVEARKGFVYEQA